MRIKVHIMHAYKNGTYVICAVSEVKVLLHILRSTLFYLQVKRFQ